MNVHQTEIIFLQEIWLHYHDEAKLKNMFPDFNFLISTPDMFNHSEDVLSSSSQVWHGSAVCWHNSINQWVRKLPSTHDRFSAILLSISDSTDILLVSLYAPTSGKDDDFLECTSFLSEFITSNLPTSGSVIIGADSNCSDKSTSRRQLIWADFCEKFSFTKETTNVSTFHHNNGLSESCIDYFLSAKCKTNNLRQICTLDSPLNFSAHDPILASILIPKKEDKPSKHTHTYTDFVRKKVVWDKSKVELYKNLTNKALAEASKAWDVPEAIPVLCSLYSDLLVKCSDLAFATKTPLKKKKREHLKKKTKNLLKEESILLKMFKEWKKAGKPRSKSNPIRQAYVRARANFQTRRRYTDGMNYVSTNNELMVSQISDRNSVYRKMKKLRNKISSPAPSCLNTPVGVYHGADTLEGFAADAEHLGRDRGDCEQFDNDFYRLCKMDNAYIFEFKQENEVKIPPMTMEDFENIIYKKMKPNKACDVYQLTVEHIREAGPVAKQCMLDLLNSILANIYFLTCPQIKTGLASSIHKGKNKPLDKSSSYRRITVTPHIGSILDRYIDPKTEEIFRPRQSPDQLGFTQNISYLMAAVERGECQRWALDNKLTCFGVSLDGEAAFPSVDRDIQIRELYSVGEQGDYLEYSRNTYTNTECKLKQDGKLSRTIKEYTGNRQGHVKAAGHFKTYINPCLEAVNSTDLGFHIGPISVGAVCCADDTYVLSDNPSGLQSSIDIVQHYAKRYRVVFNAEKTKIIVTGSKIDMKYYQDICPWSLNGEKISVAINNDHLGLIVSGLDEEQKNVDNNINKCRKSIFGLLGPAFAYSVKVSPAVQLHLWGVYCLPVLLSGLGALPIRPTVMKSVTIFHNKILRGFLKLSQTSPTPSLYFLCGELPIEGKVHLRLFSLFFNILTNPHTKAFEIVKYILMMSNEKSITWSVHLRLICRMYGLPDPLQLMQAPPPTKRSWNTLVTTKVTVYHENKWRLKAENNSKMTNLNVRMLGLSGKPHPILSKIRDSRDISKLRIQLKFLTGDVLSQERLNIDQGTDPKCRLCSAPCENYTHILTQCRGTAEVRQRLHPELLNVINDVDPGCEITNCATDEILTQFIIDASSMNLQNKYRISILHPRLQEVYSICRDWCFAIFSSRNKMLKNLK
jgi:hypothetical protein